LCVKVRLSLSYSGLVAKSVTLYFEVPDCIEIEKNPIKIDTVKGQGTPFTCEVVFYGKANCHIGNLKASVHASYFN